MTPQTAITQKIKPLDASFFVWLDDWKRYQKIADTSQIDLTARMIDGMLRLFGGGVSVKMATHGQFLPTYEIAFERGDKQTRHHLSFPDFYYEGDAERVRDRLLWEIRRVIGDIAEGSLRQWPVETVTVDVERHATASAGIPAQQWRNEAGGASDGPQLASYLAQIDPADYPDARTAETKLWLMPLGSRIQTSRGNKFVRVS